MSEGYLIDDQNKKAFLTFNKKKYYKTNDIIKKINDIYFIKSRNNNIVKIFGYRVELFEIDNQIRKIQNVKNCFIFLKKIGPYEKYIFAIIESNKIKEQFITNSLKKYLPNYMTPKQIKVLKIYPVNNNKIDRIKLTEFFEH